MREQSPVTPPDILRNTNELPYNPQELSNAHIIGSEIRESGDRWGYSLFVGRGSSKFSTSDFGYTDDQKGPLDALSYSCTPEVVAYRREFFDELMNDGEPRDRKLSKAFGSLTRSVPHLVPQEADGYRVTYEAAIRRVKKLTAFPGALRQAESQKFSPRVWQELKDYAGEFLDSNREFVTLADEIAAEGIDADNVNEAIEMLDPYAGIAIHSVSKLRHQMHVYRAFEGLFYESINPDKWSKARTVCKPNITYSSDDSFMEMKDMYHPLLTYEMPVEKSERKEGPTDEFEDDDWRYGYKRSIKMDAVPNDFSIGSDNSMMLLTGPNTGGKSGFRMAAQLNTLLVSNGFWAFAKSAEGTPFRRQWSLGELSAIIGKQGTFESVLDYGRAVLDNVTKKDIVFFDELDRGTTPADQQWFTRGVLEAFARHQIPTVGITHDLELAESLEKNPAVSFHRVADYEAGEERFKILPGIANSGYGRQKIQEKGMDPRSVDATLARRLGEHTLRNLS